MYCIRCLYFYFSVITGVWNLRGGGGGEGGCGYKCKCFVKLAPVTSTLTSHCLHDLTPLDSIMTSMYFLLTIPQ